jgi:segregation and condensation protein B
MKDVENRRLAQLIEAVLFLENGPVNIRQIARLTGSDHASIAEAVDGINGRLDEGGSALHVEKNDAGLYNLTIRPALYDALSEHYDTRKKVKLSAQALETLAIVAYRQPITKAEIERIRGVRVGHVMRILLDLELVRLRGRKDVPGKPVLYGTTEKFLKFFGLLSLDDLPELGELEM